MAVAVAPMKAHAVWPEGKERQSLPSGRCDVTLRLTASTEAAIIRAPKP